MPGYDLLLQVGVKQLRADVRVNGCSVFLSWDPTGEGGNLLLGPWLTKGMNHIEVYLAPASASSATPAATGAGGEFQLAVHRIGRGGDVWEGSGILSFQWSQAMHALRTTSPTRVLYHRVRSDTFGPWMWESATPFEDDQRGAILEVAAQLRAAIAKGDLSALRKLWSARSAEVCAAFQCTPTDMDEAIKKTLAPLLAAEDRQVNAFDADALVLDPWSDGRLVHVRQRDHSPPIICSGAGTQRAFPITLSRISNSWLIVR